MMKLNKTNKGSEEQRSEAKIEQRERVSCIPLRGGGVYKSVKVIKNIVFIKMSVEE